MEASSTRNAPNTLTPYLSPLGAWALSIGAAVGWGSLVVTSTSFLGEAGLAGSIVGLLIGVVAMVFIARNYSFMMNLYPDSGGIYTYVKSTFGCDRAYLASWFLILTYLAMFWANATSLPLFVSRFFGNVWLSIHGVWLRRIRRRGAPYDCRHHNRGHRMRTRQVLGGKGNDSSCAHLYPMHNHLLCCGHGKPWPQLV